MAYTIEQIHRIIGGELILNNSKNNRINDLLIDSRKLILAETSLFFAIKTLRNDGHNYIKELIEEGVHNFIVTRIENEWLIKKVNFIVVKDVILALQQLATAHRQQFNYPVIGITGSNGKTIVKEWLFYLLSGEYKIIRSPKSFNSRIGVPLSVWLMNNNYDIGIFEAGISEPEEMESHAKVIQPHIGIITNILQAHDENFIDKEQKVKEKLKLFDKSDYLVFSSNYDIIKKGIDRYLPKSVKLFSWGKLKNDDFRITEIKKYNDNSIISGVYNNQQLAFKIPYVDDASVENAIHCFATLLLLDYIYSDNKVSFITVLKRMLSLPPVEMRLELKEGLNNCVVVNDSYSFDIDSLKISLNFLCQQQSYQKKTVILSDIPHKQVNADLYGKIAHLLKEKNVNKIIGIGEEINKYYNVFSFAETYFYNSVEEFLNNFSEKSFNNEAILIKGARLLHLERISNILQQKTSLTRLEINLNAIEHNINVYRSLLNPNTKIMAMVKAFAYGTGSYEIANLLQFVGIDYLGVAFIDEGIELRKKGINIPIMIMNPNEMAFDKMISYDIEPEIYSFRILNNLLHTIDNSEKIFNIHIKIDSGMHRLGFVEDDIPLLIEILKKYPQIKIKSIFTHLAATEDTAKDEFTLRQLNIFIKIVELFKQNFNYDFIVHALNSCGVVRFPQYQFDMVRLGIGIYGIDGTGIIQKRLQNVGVLKSNISQIKRIKKGESVGYGNHWIVKNDSIIATVPIGYADGINRHLGNGNAKVIVNNMYAPIVGNICMDMCMIDITSLKVEEGDEVIFFNDKLTISDIAKQLGTIPYEIIANISQRVKRIYYYE